MRTWRQNSYMLLWQGSTPPGGFNWEGTISSLSFFLRYAVSSILIEMIVRFNGQYVFLHGTQSVTEYSSSVVCLFFIYIQRYLILIGLGATGLFSLFCEDFNCHPKGLARSKETLLASVKSSSAMTTWLAEKLHSGAL